uniref:Uncharacterized protein n=1 Tax=Scleropages formosus TaxID=113540 RepID=A0A8C9SSZ1_SCLFO
MSSMDWPFSSRFSISTSTLEMSKTPPTAAVSTPPERESVLDAGHETGGGGIAIRASFLLFHVVSHNNSVTFRLGNILTP